MRIGNGYDVHKLVFGRNLIIGGVHIPFEKGLLGHSDADVLIHAIIDSLLGACTARDIGAMFPDSCEKYKGIKSVLLLEEVGAFINEKGYELGNIDSVIIAQKPKLTPYISEMRNNIANALRTSINNVSVKATTEEGLGFTGSGEGVAAHAVCLLVRKGANNEDL